MTSSLSRISTISTFYAQKFVSRSTDSRIHCAPRMDTYICCLIQYDSLLHGFPQESTTCCLARRCSTPGEFSRLHLDRRFMKLNGPPPTPSISSAVSPSWFSFVFKLRMSWLQKKSERTLLRSAPASMRTTAASAWAESIARCNGVLPGKDESTLILFGGAPDAPFLPNHEWIMLTDSIWCVKSCLRSRCRGI